MHFNSWQSNSAQWSDGNRLVDGWSGEQWKHDWSPTRWGSWQSTGLGGSWHGSSWDSGQGDGWSGHQWKDDRIKKSAPDKDKYGNVTTMGLSHPLPLDDRKELLAQIISKGCPELTFPRIAVFQWKAPTVHAVFMILCRAEPGSPVRLLRDDQGLFTIEHASNVLLESFFSLHSTPERRHDVIQRLIEKCWDKQCEIIEEAKALGYDPMSVEEKTPYNCRGDTRNGVNSTGILPNLGQPTRTLARNNTEEEIERLKRKQEMLAMQRNVMQEERAMAEMKDSNGGEKSQQSSQSELLLSSDRVQ